MPHTGAFQRKEFLLAIGTAQFYLLELKNHSLSTVSSPKSLTCESALRQNRILKAVYAVYNLLTSMSRKIGLLIPRPIVTYTFKAPVPITDRPKLIETICLKSVKLLHHMRDNYIKSQVSSSHLKRVHFYIYLLRKCINLMELMLL